MISPDIQELERIHALESAPEKQPETSMEVLLRWERQYTRDLRAQNDSLRFQWGEAANYGRDMMYSRNHWRLAAAVGFGLALIAGVMR